MGSSSGRRWVLLAPLLLLALRPDSLFVGFGRQASVRDPSSRLSLTVCRAAAGSIVVIAGPPAAGKGTQRSTASCTSPQATSCART
eukprot:g27509.t1